MTSQERARRKGNVFTIMYGRYVPATEAEMYWWRVTAAQYIAGLRDSYPLTLLALQEELRATS